MNPPVELLTHRSDPRARDVLNDWLVERGRCRLGFFQLCPFADADAAAAADADAAANANADAAVAAAAADANADAAVAAAAADANANADAADAQFYKLISMESEMREGLCLVVTPGSRWGCLTRVGWLRRVDGDEWELHGARSLLTRGKYVPLATVAKNGPTSDTEAQEVAEFPEDINRLHVIRTVRCNEKAWAKACPRPDGWVDR